MNRPIVLLSLAAFALPLSACATDSYDGRFYADAAYPYDGYYDGFYGPIYDGYWGSNGYFYYRANSGGRFIRGDHNHFRPGNAAPSPGGKFQPMQGNTRPMAGTKMPHFNGTRINNGGRNGRR